jgi:hypothetical protein
MQKYKNRNLIKRKEPILWFSIHLILRPRLKRKVRWYIYFKPLLGHIFVYLPYVLRFGPSSGCIWPASASILYVVQGWSRCTFIEVAATSKLTESSRTYRLEKHACVMTICIIKKSRITKFYRSTKEVNRTRYLTIKCIDSMKLKLWHIYN